MNNAVWVSFIGSNLCGRRAPWRGRGASVRRRARAWSPSCRQPPPTCRRPSACAASPGPTPAPTCCSPVVFAVETQRTDHGRQFFKREGENHEPLNSWLFVVSKAQTKFLRFLRRFRSILRVIGHFVESSIWLHILQISAGSKTRDPFPYPALAGTYGNSLHTE